MLWCHIVHKFLKNQWFWFCRVRWSDHQLLQMSNFWNTVIVQDLCFLWNRKNLWFYDCLATLTVTTRAIRVPGFPCHLLIFKSTTHPSVSHSPINHPRCEQCRPATSLLSQKSNDPESGKHEERRHFPYLFVIKRGRGKRVIKFINLPISREVIVRVQLSLSLKVIRTWKFAKYLVEYSLKIDIFRIFL